MEWQNDNIEELTPESNIGLENNLTQQDELYDIDEATGAEESNELSPEDKLANKVETAGKIVENSGRAVEATGASIQATGAGIEATGKGMQVAGKSIEAVGKGVEVVGKAANKGGQSTIEAGAELSSTGIGAIVGVPMIAAGAVLSGAGTVAEVTGKGAQATGKAVDKTGKAVDEAGKKVKQTGKDVKRKGKQLKQRGRDIKKNSNDIRRMQDLKKNRKLNGLMPLNNNKYLNSKKGNKNSSSRLAEIQNLKGKISIFVKIKIILLAAIVTIPILGLMIFVAIFNEESSGGNSSAGNFMYGETCTTITVTNTGCDADAQNCSNEYDGEVSFEEYIAGVVAAEVGSANNLEYYKVTAIAARTYFLNSTGGSCTVNGNATFQAYMDVNDSANAELIKQAVSETENMVLLKEDKLITTYYASACVVNADDEYYYVRYGTRSLGTANFQKIPKEWDQNESVYKNYLSNWYSLTDQNNTDYENKSCPKNHDYGMTQLGALYLITSEGYTYEEVFKYYYGQDTEIIKNEMQLTGNAGFVNPTRFVNCSSPFGYRTHPVNGGQELHTGLDIAIVGGEAIYAASTGVVRKVVNNVSAINNCSYGYGNYVIIDHAEGLSTLYAHIKYGSIPDSITAGMTISQGEQIGQVGSTGCSTGNHLHYEVRLNNLHIDPANYMDLNSATGICKR